MHVLLPVVVNTLGDLLIDNWPYGNFLPVGKRRRGRYQIV